MYVNVGCTSCVYRECCVLVPRNYMLLCRTKILYVMYVCRASSVCTLYKCCMRCVFRLNVMYMSCSCCV